MSLQDAKVSLESRELRNTSDADVNNPNSKDYVRFFDAKTETDADTIFFDGHLGGSVFVEETRDYELKPNVNFYGIATSSESSAVHVPTPVYKRSELVWFLFASCLGFKVWIAFGPGFRSVFGCGLRMRMKFQTVI